MYTYKHLILAYGLLTEWWPYATVTGTLFIINAIVFVYLGVVLVTNNLKLQYCYLLHQPQGFSYICLKMIKVDRFELLTQFYIQAKRVGFTTTLPDSSPF